MPEAPLNVGQLNPPDLDALLAEFEGIFERGYYANHGPLVRRFEEALAYRLGVGHVVCMTNGTAALMVAAKALGLSGEVVTPAFTFPATVQALEWAGLEPVFCDVDPVTHAMTPETAAVCLTDRTVALLAVHLWGHPCDVDGLTRLARQRNLRLMFDAAHAFGSSYRGRQVGGFGDVEMFSFHATKILNCAEGGCVTTDDDDLAAAFRTARNFHEQETFVEVPLRINAKMSEAQAAFGLVSLADLDRNIAANHARYHRYRDALAAMPGVTLFLHVEGASNYQYVVAEIDEAEYGMDRDRLMAVLKSNGVVARRYFYPGMHHAVPFNGRSWTLPETDRLCTRVLQLPSGDGVGDAEVDGVVDLLRTARNAVFPQA